MRTLAILILAGTAAWAADAKAGQAAYEKACRSCHGPDGAPNASIAKMMKVEIRDLKAAEVQALSNAEMRKIVTDGKGKMMAIKTVSGPAVDDVIAYVRSLKK